MGLPLAGAARLLRNGHEVFVEAGAGVGQGFDDNVHAAAGAQLVDQETAWAPSCC